MSKLILHVGTHKTATTTIQDLLALNRAKLAQERLIYPKLGRVSGHHGLVADWITLPSQYHYAEGSVGAWKALARDYARSDKTVLLSTEEFSRGDPRQRVNLADIRDICSGFDEFQVVCCIRNQISFLQSIYLQVAKTTVAVPWSRLFDRAVKQHVATGLFMDFNNLYAHLQRGFAPEEIRFFIFDEAVKRPDGIIGQILDLAGFPGLTPDLKPLGTGNSNVSQDPLAAWASAQIAENASAGAPLLAIARRVLEQEFGKDAKTTVYTEEEKKQLIRTFDPLNRKFEDDIRKTGHDLSIVWPKPNPDMVHRGDIKLRYWIRLSRALYAASPKLHK
ncbi:hypothetical protein EDD52_11141 [Primorskyibacter sedentarius]|uniref:Sulfotransferase family protein n=1 Tax=Primorskyibacter sedentarius TaxID=745311 RepID=A0A4R3J7Q6_9RHOB|nr:hypothetical protein [Primorskyibacter sedentarius]TCS61444.1 hypothetical protein EDD52_11141 [Primorskyibacter sedentarius]